MNLHRGGPIKGQRAIEQTIGMSQVIEALAQALRIAPIPVQDVAPWNQVRFSQPAFKIGDKEYPFVLEFRSSNEDESLLSVFADQHPQTGDWSFALPPHSPFRVRSMILEPVDPRIPRGIMIPWPVRTRTLRLHHGAVEAITWTRRQPWMDLQEEDRLPLIRHFSAHLSKLSDIELQRLDEDEEAVQAIIGSFVAARNAAAPSQESSSTENGALTASRGFSDPTETS